jgi:hypothetical protein
MLICFVVPVVFKYSLYATGESYLLWIKAPSMHPMQARLILYLRPSFGLRFFSPSSELSICSCHSLSFVLLREFEDTLY